MTTEPKRPKGDDVDLPAQISELVETLEGYGLIDSAHVAEVDDAVRSSDHPDPTDNHAPPAIPDEEN